MKIVYRQIQSNRQRSKNTMTNTMKYTKKYPRMKTHTIHDELAKKEGRTQT